NDGIRSAITSTVSPLNGMSTAATSGFTSPRKAITPPPTL
ncbi:MAG: hypothetical protein RL354_2156, partial [Planctomycetota bacterium]